MYLKFMRVPLPPPIQGPVVQMVDSTIQWINLHSVGSAMPSPILSYLLNSGLSDGYKHYPAFE